MADDYYRKRWDDPRTPLEQRVLIVMVVSVGVEGCRLYFHPESWAKLSLLVFSVVMNFAYHLWSMPTDAKRTAISALLAEVSMPVLLTLVGKLLQAVLTATLVFLRDLIESA